MTSDPRDPLPLPPTAAPIEPPDEIDPELAALGYVPPDPDEPRPLDLWGAVGHLRPWVTVSLLLAWAAVFLLMAVRARVQDSAMLMVWGASVTGSSWRESAWRLLASTFVHAGFAHLASNAASLLVMGPAVERIYTRRGAVVVVALGGALASLASLAWRAARDPGGFSVSVGGSGVVFALGGALLVAAFRLRRVLPVSRARAFAAALMLLTLPALANGFTRHGTDNAAHAAGLLAGALLGALLPVHPRLGGRAPGFARTSLAALAALALLAALVLGARGGLRAG
jgi:rhomboid protease GluP